MTKQQPNAAQQILAALGVPVGEAVKQAHGSKNPSATKAGPGRYHRAEHTKDSPRSSAGAPRDFVLHQASPAKKERRALVKAHGRRQAINAIKYDRMLARWEAKVAEDERLAA